MRSGASVLSLVFVAAALLGCTRMERARQCAQLVSIVNPALDEIKELYTSRPRDAATFREVAERYDALAGRIDGVGFANADVKESADEYRALLQATAKAARAISVSLESKDDKELSRARAELDRAVRREKGAVLKLDADCHAP